MERKNRAMTLSHFVIEIEREKDLKSFKCQSISQLKSVIALHEQLHRSMTEKIIELEKDKAILYDQSLDHQKQMEDLKLDLHNSEKALVELHQQHELENYEILSQIQLLQRDISTLSSSAVVKEKETLRKELEKTKSKLKDTESKLKNAVQDKVRLESEKAHIERENKKLHGQKTLLERDISKWESLADKRQESIADWRREANDLSRAKAHYDVVEQKLQLKEVEIERANFDLEILSGDYKKLEDRISEMEMKIASLEEDLLVVNEEKAAALARNEALVLELETVTSKLDTANSEIKALQEEVNEMRLSLARSESLCQKLESSINCVSREKEEMALQLTEALLELEEERVIWSSKEKASVESIADKAKITNAEISLLSKELSEARVELESCREQCRLLSESLAISEEKAEREEKCCLQKFSEIDKLRDELRDCETKNALCQEKFKGEVLLIMSERDKLLVKNKELQRVAMEVETVKTSFDDTLSKAKIEVEELTRRLSYMEDKIHDGAMINSKEQAQFRLRLRMTQAKLDMYQSKYAALLDEKEYMHRSYTEATTKLKQQLASVAMEKSRLKKQLAAANE